MKKHKGKLVLVILLSVLVIGLIFGFMLVNNGIKTHNVADDTIITIDSSMGAKDVFDHLQEIGAINSGDIAYYYSRFLHPSNFKAGSYYMPKDTDLKGMIDYLSNAENSIKNTIMVTFIEGDWLKDFARKLAEKTNLNADELMNYWDDKTVIEGYINTYPFLTDAILGENVRHPLEGYFFPETYEFYIETSPEAVTKRLLDQTNVIYQKYQSAFENSSLSTHEIFTLASIVQYEASNVQDMHDVAGVFYNRLNDGMRLQSSVTVCYAIDIEPGEDWVACETNSDYDNPYNTYQNDGLPPGPILNPGEAAINAVLNPSSHDYYYFIGDVCGDGKVHFASTLEEHNANVQEYLWCY